MSVWYDLCFFLIGVVGKNYENCNFGNNLGYVVVIRKGNSDISKIIEILIVMSDMYGSN